MLELSQEAKMIIASNLTVAAAIRDAAMTAKGAPQPGEPGEPGEPGDSKDLVTLVTQMFAAILANLEKQSLGREHER